MILSAHAKERWMTACDANTPSDEGVLLCHAYADPGWAYGASNVVQPYV